MTIKINGTTVISDSQAITSTSTISATGNITAGNVTTTGTISATTIVANVTPPTGGTVSTTGNVTGGNVLTSGIVSATGNITGSYVLGNGSQLTGIDATSIQNGTSSVSVIASGGNVRANVAGATITTTSASGVAVTGIVSATGNITGSYVLGNGSQLTGIDATSIQNGTSSVSVIASGGNVRANVAGATITTTSASGVAVTGIVSATGNITGGNVNVGNITIATDLISSLNSTITIDPATVGNAGLVVINGNLQVNGNTTTINSNVVSTNDLTVNYANNAINSAAANGGGIEVGPIGGAFITWLYNNTANVWTSSGGVSAVGNITGGNILGGANVNATTHTGSTVSVTGNIDGGNLRTGGLISATGAITVGGDMSLIGNIVDTGALTVSTSSNGNITLSPNGSGVIVASKDIVNGQGNGVGNIGSATGYFNTVFAKATSAQYADLAEKYEADAEYAPGTVLSFGGAKEVTLANEAGSTRVAGVVSTNPSYIMNATLEAEHVAMVALQGRVPCRVIGPIAKGDMMVAAGNGAARVDNAARAGSIIGKALENFDGAEGTIEVVIGRN